MIMNEKEKKRILFIIIAEKWFVVFFMFLFV